MRRDDIFFIIICCEDAHTPNARKIPPLSTRMTREKWWRHTKRIIFWAYNFSNPDRDVRALSLVNISTLAARQILNVFYRLLLAFIFHSIKVFFLLSLALPNREHVFDCVLNAGSVCEWFGTRFCIVSYQLVAHVLIKFPSDDGKTRSEEIKWSVRKRASERMYNIRGHTAMSQKHSPSKKMWRRKNPLMIKKI
jgi:hypothetical protein